MGQPAVHTEHLPKGESNDLMLLASRRIKATCDQSAVIIPRQIVPLFSTTSRKNVTRIAVESTACRGSEKMLIRGQLTQLHTVGAPHPSPALLYMHIYTIPQRSQFRDDSRTMQSSLISRLLGSALAAGR